MYIYGNNYKTFNSEHDNDLSCIIEVYKNNTLISTNSYTCKQLLDMSVTIRNTNITYADVYFSNLNLPEEYNIQNLYGYEVEDDKVQFTSIIKKYDGIFNNLPSDSISYINISSCINRMSYYEYILAPTQLDATADLLYNSIAYGKNGIIEGTITQNVSNSFADINAEIYYKLQQAYDNMEPRILTDDDKTIDKNIYFIPIKPDGTPLLDTSKVTNMQSMFSSCKDLTTIPLLDTSKVTDMNFMFNGCTNLTTVPQLNTSQATNLSFMFGGCTNLTTIPQLNTSRATNLSSMFVNCTNLQSVPLLDTSNVTTMNGMFSSCTNLTTIPLLDTSNVTNMALMFSSCTNLTTIPLLDTSSATIMQNMFYGCDNLNNESLNNILASLITATSYAGEKTLLKIGLSETQAQTCTSLSNWSACEAAGWTTGY